MCGTASEPIPPVLVVEFLDQIIYTKVMYFPALNHKVETCLHFQFLATASLISISKFETRVICAASEGRI